MKKCLVEMSYGTCAYLGMFEKENGITAKLTEMLAFLMEDRIGIATVKAFIWRVTSIHEQGVECELALGNNV